jgi:hypothetical protein
VHDLGERLPIRSLVGVLGALPSGLYRATSAILGMVDKQDGSLVYGELSFRGLPSSMLYPEARPDLLLQKSFSPLCDGAYLLAERIEEGSRAGAGGRAAR